MTMKQTSVPFVLVATALLTAADWLHSADENSKAPVSAHDAVLVLPEFSKALNISEAAAALRAEDSDALAKIAQSLANAERERGTPNKPLPAESLFQTGVRIVLAESRPSSRQRTH
jgi:hypothetical protein